MKPASKTEDTMPVSPAALVAAQPAEQTLRALDEPEEIARFTRWEQGADGRRCGVSGLQLAGLHCAACAGLIEDALLRVPGVSDARVNASARRALVRWDPAVTRPSALVEAVQRAGYGAAADVAAAARELRRDEHRAALWRLFVASFLAMQVMMLATPSYVAPEGDLSPDLRSLLNWGSWVLSLPVLGFAGMPFLKGAWHSLRARRIGMDVPVALGLLGAFVASSAATFDPAGAFGHEVYFDSLTMFLAFLWLGRYLEVRMRHRAAEALEAAVKLSHRYIPARQLPDKAVSLLDTASARVAISQHAVPAEVDDCRKRIQAMETELEIIGRIDPKALRDKEVKL